MVQDFVYKMDAGFKIFLKERGKGINIFSVAFSAKDDSLGKNITGTVWSYI